MNRLLLILAMANPFAAFATEGVIEDIATRVYALADVDRPPQLMLMARLAYPAELKAQGIAGEVVIECVVDRDGSLRDPVVKSSTRKEFELPALQSVSKWKFKPARKEKKPVNVRQEVTVKFDPKKK